MRRRLALTGLAGLDWGAGWSSGSGSLVVVVAEVAVVVGASGDVVGRSVWGVLDGDGSGLSVSSAVGDGVVAGCVVDTGSAPATAVSGVSLAVTVAAGRSACGGCSLETSWASSFVAIDAPVVAAAGDGDCELVLLSASAVAEVVAAVTAVVDVSGSTSSVTTVSVAAVAVVVEEVATGVVVALEAAAEPPAASSTASVFPTSFGCVVSFVAA